MPPENVTQIHAEPVEMQRESRTLAAMRDALLPKLLSGEIRVKHAERAVQAAV
jgi:type I restriction enzyme S subunit